MNNHDSSFRVGSNWDKSRGSITHYKYLEVDAKWNKLNQITHWGIKSQKNQKRNKNLTKNGGGLTHDFGSSFSSQERKRKRDNIKNHKLSCDSSLLKSHIDNQKFSSSPAVKWKRRQTKGSLVNKNNENDAKYFLDNNDSIPHMNTKESHFTVSNRVRLNLIMSLQDFLNTDNEKTEPINLKASKEKHLIVSDWEGSKDNSALGVKTYQQIWKSPIYDKDLNLLRAEIKAFLWAENTNPTSQFIEKIHNVYENHISIQDKEIMALASNLNTLKQSESVRNRGNLPDFISLENKQFASNPSNSNWEVKSGKKLKILKYSNIEYFKDSSNHKAKNLNTNSGARKKSQTSAGFTIWEKKGKMKKIYTPSHKEYDAEKINEFVDNEIDLSFQDIHDSPSQAERSPQKWVEENNKKNTVNKEGESIVPPLSLQNIGANKYTQNGTTGKLTRTTMHSTQIRDKMPLNNLKNNIVTWQSKEKSNADSKSLLS